MTARRDFGWMEMAYALAEKARGRTSPNPMVGAAVVRGGTLVGHGYHAQAGQPHAEILALRMAGRLARGATLYLTLEPCVHWGRTPPCVDTVLGAGLARIVISAVDPNPVIHTKGIRRLKEAGLDVSVGLLAARNAVLNEATIKHIIRRIPFVTLKAALTFDGKIACRTGDSKWITSAATRDYVHLLRGEQDALMIGAGTLVADDPLLTVRHANWPGKTLLRAVLDPGLRFPPAARLLGTLDRGPVVVFAGRDAPADRAEALRARGAEVLAPPDGAAGWDLEHVLAELGRRDITALLVEGGGRLFTSFVEGGFADKAVLTYAPLLAGGAAAPGFIGGAGAGAMGEAIRLRRTRAFPIGNDIVVEGYF